MGPVTKRKAKPSFFAELKRRKVFRVAVTYMVVAWVIVQVAAATFGGFGIPAWAFRFIVLMLMLGFPVALIITRAFDLTAANVFEIQSEITGSIAQALKAELSPEAQQRLGNLTTRNLAALEAYFKGGIASELLTDEGFREAIGHFKEAIHLDPDFAEAYVAKGHYHYQLREFEDAEAAYEKAIGLNPNNHVAYLMYGLLMQWGSGDLQKAVRLFARALELAPNDKDIQRNLAGAYASSGRIAPASANEPVRKGYLRIFEGKLDEAKSEFEKTLPISNLFPWVVRNLAKLYMNEGGHQKALDLFAASNPELRDE